MLNTSRTLGSGDVARLESIQDVFGQYAPSRHVVMEGTMLDLHCRRMAHSNLQSGLSTSIRQTGNGVDINGR